MYTNLQNCKQVVLDGLKEIGALLVMVEFSGSGDSGECSRVEITDKDSADLTKTAKTINVTYKETANVGWRNTLPMDITEKTQNLRAAVEHLAYMELMNTGVDWYNNDGGDATWLLDFGDDIQHLTVEVHEAKDEVNEDNDDSNFEIDIITTTKFDNGMPSIEEWRTT